LFLHSATLGDLSMVRQIVNFVDINAPDSMGVTAVNSASFYGHLDTIKYLTKHNADVLILSNKGNSPLYGATFSGHSRCVEFLISQGAELNSRNFYGFVLF
jgi:ankyrin repeat protein